jgi:hypothetical protein
MVHFAFKLKGPVSKPVTEQNEKKSRSWDLQAYLRELWLAKVKQNPSIFDSLVSHEHGRCNCGCSRVWLGERRNKI